MFDLRQELKLHTSMSFRATTLRRYSWAGLLLGLMVVPVHGQAANSPVAFVNQAAITTSFVSTPSLIGAEGSGGSNQNSQWLKVEFHYGITPAKGDYQDAVEFKIWIEGRDLLATDAPVKGQGVAVGLTGSVTYVNIPRDKDNYGVFYVHPSTLGRYSAGGGADDFEHKFNIHIEAYVGGNKMDYFDKNKERDLNWYQTLRPVPGLVYRQDQCPFLVVDCDRYPAIKASEATQ